LYDATFLVRLAGFEQTAITRLRQMRVLHVIPSIALVHGGPSVAVFTMCAALQLRDIEVAVATTDDDGPGRRSLLQFGVDEREGGVPVYRFRKQTEWYKVSWPFVGWLRRNVKRYDLLHIHALFSFTSVMAAQIARDAGVPYVLRPLGTLSPYGMTQRRHLLKRLSLACVEGPLLRDAAAVHFTSVVEAQEAADLGLRLRGRIVPLGLPPAATGNADVWPQLLGLPVRANCIVFLSRLDPKKNLPGLLVAAELLKERGYDLHWLIGGDGPADYVIQLQRHSEARGLQGCVHWLGRVDGQAKADLLAAGQLFVLPSFAENFGIAVAEALASGLPCVVGQGVALGQAIVEHGAGLTVDTDAESIAQGVERLLCDEPRRAAASLAARQFAEAEFSQDALGHRLVTMYVELLSGEPRR
jgi:glycosyltransferase involved in cell wall biosynthesis